MTPYAEGNLPIVWKFQHDNDPKHTAKIITEFFVQKQIDVCIEMASPNSRFKLYREIVGAIGNCRQK